MTSDNDLRRHLIEVARCRHLVECLDATAPHQPCATVALTQWPADVSPEDRVAGWRNVHQLPEPWVGHLRGARILFVSSNPSITGAIPADPVHAQPRADRLTWGWDDATIADRYERAFDDYMIDGVRTIGSHKATRYWASIKLRAEELIPWRPVRPGYDYVLTEAVRCKSRDERGVAKAISVCAPAYLSRTIALSEAPVIVSIGAHARRALHDHLGVRSTDGLAELRTNGLLQLVAFLPAPNARGVPKSFAKNLSADQLERLKAHLHEHDR